MDQASHPPLPGNNSAEKITELFKVVSKTFREFYCEQVRQYGLTISQAWVIFALHKKPYQNLFELSQELGLSKSTLSGIVDRLVTQGIVLREIPGENRRTVKLSLSPQFTQINELMESRERFFNRIITAATPEELETIIAGLETLLRVMRVNY